MQQLLTLSNIVTGYNDKPIINGVSFSVNKGEIVAILGHNGAGKTTLLKTIFGLLKPTEGNVEKHGKVVYVPQGMRVFPNLTVKENILLMVDMKHVPESIFELFPTLKHRQTAYAGNLSGGEQQMVALARAILQEPDLILLDEPSLGLSPKLVQEMFITINMLREKFGCSILVIEHNIASLSKILDRAYILEKGKIKKEVTTFEEIQKHLL